MPPPLRILFYCQEDDRSLVELIEYKYGNRYEFNVQSDSTLLLKEITEFAPHCIVIAKPTTGVEAFTIQRKARIDKKQVPLIFFASEDEEKYPVAFFSGSFENTKKLNETSDRLKKLIIRLTNKLLQLPPSLNQLEIGGKTIFLTNRERDVIDILITGANNSAIANKLNIEKRTVETHIANIFNKVGVKNRTALMAIALKQ